MQAVGVDSGHTEENLRQIGEQGSEADACFLLAIGLFSVYWR
jgi:hypothetical protein